jgi:hypothetical protein
MLRPLKLKLTKTSRPSQKDIKSKYSLFFKEFKLAVIQTFYKLLFLCLMTLTIMQDCTQQCQN